ncbi:MAG: hypothetical protein LC624_10065, partial [Halobacteriales archaeon]|nr:hypothetical protein [Halobacteriales archaeon]
MRAEGKVLWREVTAALVLVTVYAPVVAADDAFVFNITLTVDNWDNVRYGSSEDNQPIKFAHVELRDGNGQVLSEGRTATDGRITLSCNCIIATGLIVRTYSDYLPEHAIHFVNVTTEAGAVHSFDFAIPNLLTSGTYSYDVKPQSAVDAAPFYILVQA